MVSKRDFQRRSDHRQWRGRRDLAICGLRRRQFRIAWASSRPTAGAGTVLITAGSSGNTSLTFGSLAAPAAGTGLNLKTDTSAGGTASFSFLSAANVNGILNAHVYFNGANFAAGSTVGAATYTSEGSALASGLTTPTLVTGSYTQGAGITVNAGIKFSSAQTLTLSGATGIVTINNGANVSGGILVAGGVTANIIGTGAAGFGITTNGSGRSGFPHRYGGGRPESECADPRDHDRRLDEERRRHPSSLRDQYRPHDDECGQYQRRHREILWRCSQAAAPERRQRQRQSPPGSDVRSERRHVGQRHQHPGWSRHGDQ